MMFDALKTIRFYSGRLGVGLIALALAGSALAAGPAKVLVVPFDAVGPADKQWIAKAVQQNLIAELGRVSSVQAVTFDRPLADNPAALKAAADAGADYVVFGTYQVNDADLRITGQVLDVSKKLSIAGLKATGTQRDLFGLEDVIAAQVKKSLPQPAVVQPEMLQQPPAGAAMAAPAVAAQPIIAPERIADLNRALARVNDLEAQINRAAERLRNLDIPAYNNDYGYSSYPYYSSGLYGYSPISYIGYSNVCSNNGFNGGFRHHNHGRSEISGSWSGGHSSINFNLGQGPNTWGGAVPDGRNYNVPSANYVVHPPNYMKATTR